MDKLKNIFWNSDESRLRTGWRITILIIFLIIFTTIFTVIDSLFNDILPRSPLTTKRSILFSFWMVLSFYFSIWITARFFDKRKLVEIGLNINRVWWKDFGFGLLLGALLHSLIFLSQYFAGWIKVTGTFQNNLTQFSFGAGFAIWIFTFICAGISEDLLNRGYLLKNISEGIRSNKTGNKKAIAWAIIITSILFGVMHAWNPNASFISTSGLMIAGLMYATAYILTGQLALPIGLHITWNFFEGCVFGSPVSGQTTGLSIIATEQIGPDIITGGAFGPEAGLLGIASRFLAIFLIFWWVKSTREKPGVIEQIAIYSPSKKQI